MSNLFAEFDKVDQKQWLEKATADLKGKNPEEAYSIDLADGIQIKPYYDMEDRPSESVNVSSLRIQRDFDPWFNTAPINVKNDKEANESSLKLLESGVNGLKFNFPDGTPDLNTLLNSIKLNYCFTSFDQVSAEKLSKTFESIINDDIRKEIEATVVTTGGKNKTQQSIDKLLVEAELFGAYKRVRTIPIEITNLSVDEFCNELAKSLSWFVEIITENVKIPIFELFNRVFVSTLLSNSYFLEVAKLRAIRIVFANLARCYEIENQQIFIQAETVIDQDELKSLLTNTTQTMSAVIGGADAIITHPNQSEPTEQANRIARNISHLLREESHLDKVSDPAAGSYYLDHLTMAISNEVWSQFLKIEENGGYFKHFAS